MAAPARLIAVVGMAREAKIIAGDGVTTVIGGGDSAALERKLEAVLSRDATALLISFGICGALSPELKPGDVVVAARVTAQGWRYGADPVWTAHLTGAMPSAHLVDIAGEDVMVGDVAAKQALRASTGAAAVDMESHVVARLAHRAGRPFVVARAVSDAADQALPRAALAGLKANGQPNLAGVLGSLALNPGQLPALMRTAQDAELGFNALKRVAGALRWLM
jgi:hopanoid-associated phosphorylase